MWTEKNDSLQKTYEFKDFEEAMAFMAAAARLCEELNHHPTWTNVYNRIEVILCTHDAGNKVTEKDHVLATSFDKLYEARHAAG